MRPDRTPRRRTLSVGAGLLAYGSRLRVRPSQRPKTSVTRNGPSARRSQLRGQRRHHTGFPLSSASPGSDAQNLDLFMRRAPDAEVKKHIRISLWLLSAVIIAHAVQLSGVTAPRAQQTLNSILLDLGLPQTPRGSLSSDNAKAKRRHGRSARVASLCADSDHISSTFLGVPPQFEEVLSSR